MRRLTRLSAFPLLTGLLFTHAHAHSHFPAPPVCPRRFMGCSASMADSGEVAPIFRIGVIADVQYADIEDGTDFQKTENRRFRNSLEIMKRAVKSWNDINANSDVPIEFIAQLGDLLDGKAKDHIERATASVKEVIQSCDVKKWVHLIGNHELYHLCRAGMAEAGLGDIEGGDRTFYTYKPHQGWKVVVLDPYQISIIGVEKGGPVYKQALEILKKNNPNDVESSCDWTKGLEGEDLRFLPYNGALGDEQLAWMKKEIGEAAEAGEKVIVMAHTPLRHEAAKYQNVCWDGPSACAILAEHPGVVRLVLTGHDHLGGYFFDEVNGIHHVTFQSPLLAVGDEDCFGRIDMFPDRAELVSTGCVPARSMKFPEPEQKKA